MHFLELQPVSATRIRTHSKLKRRNNAGSNALLGSLGTIVLLTLLVAGLFAALHRKLFP